MQYLRSILFIGQMYVAMVVLAVAYFPWAVMSSAGAHAACHAYCRWVLWTLAWMTGLRTEVRGTPPTGEVMIAAKHQSFLDILMIYNAVPRGKFIMKRELIYTPLFGQYALRIGSVPVNRGKRGAAIAKMLADVKSGRQQGGQLIIYPQGTRVAPGVARPYKIGTGALYEQLGQPCVPVATNVGVFWPRHGLLRKPGLAVVEFLPPIPPGLPRDAFMARLETEVETASDALMAEAGFHAHP
ncbi:MAG: 1-acyl-sn-glycerol-3-phosphate acyltransferase [Roseicyclus sp.]|nr:1-acyl-sn-glycerol-3-phosphate acyltransferase [Roseicyclus sp.]